MVTTYWLLGENTKPQPEVPSIEEVENQRKLGPTVGIALPRIKQVNPTYRPSSIAEEVLAPNETNNLAPEIINNLRYSDPNVSSANEALPLLPPPANNNKAKTARFKGNGVAFQSTPETPLINGHAEDMV